MNAAGANCTGNVWGATGAERWPEISQQGLWLTVELFAPIAFGIPDIIGQPAPQFIELGFSWQGVEASAVPHAITSKST